MLSIYEELFLLALDEEKGNILPFAKKTIAHAISGGILAELILQDKLSSSEKRRMELANSSLTGDAILDDAITEIQASEKPRKLTFWVSQLSAHPKRLRELIGEGLKTKGLLIQEENRLYWQSSPSEENALSASSKYEMKKPLRASVLSSSEDSDYHALALLKVAGAAGLLDLIFTHDELQIAAQRIHEKVVRAALENPAMQTIEELEQAVMTSLEDDSD